MRPFYIADGVVRFQENTIVHKLLEEARKRGFTLNDLVAGEHPQADWEEFYQLIGYSLAGYHELSLVSDVSALEATDMARQQFPTVSGCRDHGCEIHCGVEAKP